MDLSVDRALDDDDEINNYFKIIKLITALIAGTTILEGTRVHIQS